MIGVLFFTFDLFAQNVDEDLFHHHKTIPELVALSGLIVEGSVVSQNSFWNKEHTEIFTENKIKAQKLYKGIQEDSFIYVITYGGIVGNDLIKVSHAANIDGQTDGLFFLKKSSNKSLDNNREYYEAVSSEESFTWLHDLSAHPYFVFDKKRIAAQDLKQNIEICTRQSAYLPENSNATVHKIPCKIYPIELSPTISFSFDKVVLSDDYQYVNFNIQAAADANNFSFGKGVIILKFPEGNPIGTFLATNGILKVEQTALVPSEVYDLVLQDLDANTVKISISPKSSALQNLNTLMNIKEDFLSIKLKITNFSNASKISFDNILMQGNCYYYCNGTFAPFKSIKTSKSIESITPPKELQIPITYTFENLKVESVNSPNDYLSFDVFAQTAQKTFFKDALIQIKYNDVTAFFSNQETSNSIIVERGALIQNTNVYNFSYNDNILSANNVVDFAIEAKNTTALAVLDQTPIKVMNVKFKYLNGDACKIAPNLLFQESSMQNLSTYQVSTGTLAMNYTPVLAKDVESSPTCGCNGKIKITSFFPSKIPAGAGEILTIKGENFGFEIGAIQFPNADDGGKSMMNTAARDFIWNGITHWTDTEIQVKVPSTDAASKIGERPAGSGKFIVKQGLCLDEAESPSALFIPYALTNIRIKNLEALPVGLACKNKFSMNGDNSSATNDNFQFAINKWNQVTNLGFTVLPQKVTAKKNATDGFNTVYEGVSVEGEGGAFHAGLAHYELCGNNTGFMLVDIDIYGVPEKLPDLLQYQAMFMHELGHVQALSHSLKKSVLPFEDLMYYSKSFSAIPPIDGDVAVSAKLITSTSTNIYTNGQCLNKPIVVGGNCAITSIYEQIEENTISIFPNPTGINEIVTINYLENYTFSIFNSLGDLLINQKNNYSKTQINIASFVSGIYFIKVWNDNNELFTYKIVVQ